jgi:hypothetical protein
MFGKKSNISTSVFGQKSKVAHNSFGNKHVARNRHVAVIQQSNHGTPKQSDLEKYQSNR